jgi:glutamine amidotransferase
MGLQVLLERSEEDSDTPGLALVAGEVRRLPRYDRASGERLKIPHMGWNNVHITAAHPLWRGIEDRERFYFVHSYFAATLDPAIVAGTARYGTDFPCAIAERSLFAVQFHPEKSERAGLRLLKNFLEWDP